MTNKEYYKQWYAKNRDKVLCRIKKYRKQHKKYFEDYQKLYKKHTENKRKNITNFTAQEKSMGCQRPIGICY